MDSTSQMSHVAPADQPDSVHQIAERLFPAYTVDGGSVRLAGCTLEDRLFLRFQFGHGAESTEIFVDADRQQVDRETAAAMGMLQTRELDKPPRPFAGKIEPLTQFGERLVAEKLAPATPPELVSTTAIWCKFAAGKLRFSIGEGSVDLAFSGWSRTLQPPPFICPHTGMATFHLATTDDGRIATADQIEPCAETGRRMLKEELVASSLSGRRALAEWIETCPVTLEPVLRSELVPCGMCGQPVSPLSIERNECAACRQLEPIDADDPRLTRLLKKHPELGRWRHWQISETSTVQIFLATGWVQRLVLAVGKDSLDIRHTATSNRLRTGWRALSSTIAEMRRMSLF